MSRQKRMRLEQVNQVRYLPEELDATGKTSQMDLLERADQNNVAFNRNILI